MRFTECSVFTVFRELFNEHKKGAFKLIEEAEKTWNRIHCTDKITELLNAAVFNNG